MGDRGKSDAMKNRRTNLETAELEADKPPAAKGETRDSMGTAAIPTRPTARLDREAQVRIGQQLRAMYDEVVSEGVPPRIADLVRRLCEQE